MSLSLSISLSSSTSNCFAIAISFDTFTNTYHCLLSLQIYLYLISLQIYYTLQQQFRLINSNLEIEKDSNNLRGRRQLPGKGKKLGLLIAKAKNPWAGEPGEGNPDGISSEDEHTMEQQQWIV